MRGSLRGLARVVYQRTQGSAGCSYWHWVKKNKKRDLPKGIFPSRDDNSAFRYCFKFATVASTLRVLT